MKRNIRIACLACAVFLVLVPFVTACWVAVTLESLVTRHTLIVVGEVTEIEEATWESGEEGNRRILDTATITISEVLKNETDIPPGQLATIKMNMPSRKSDWRMSTDQYFPVGTGGVWMFTPENGSFRISHPDQLRPLSLLPEIRALLESEAASGDSATHDHPEEVVVPEESEGTARNRKTSDARE